MSYDADSESLRDKLAPFGLTAEEAELYIFLLRSGSMRALEVSRELEIPRTNVYRAGDRLVEKALIRYTDGSRGRELAPLGPRSLEDFLARQQRELDARKRELPSVLGELVNVAANELGSRVIHYDGIEGVRQITRNSVEASGSLKIFELSSLNALFDRDEAEALRRQFVERNIFIQQITNLKRIDAWTDVIELIDRLWECRRLDPNALHFEYELLIYDDVYAAYNFNEKDVFGIEIRSAALARTQARLFDFVWANSARMRKIGHRGEVRAAPQK